MNSGIYRFINFINGKMYIGSAVNLKNRKKNHLLMLKYNKHYNVYLQAAWNKYGSLIFEVLEYVEVKEKLIEREQYWLDKYKSYNREKGYNLSPTAGSPLGVKHTKETIAKVQKAKENLVRTKEWNNNIAKALTGKKATAIAKSNISKALTGRTLSLEHAEKIGNYQRNLEKWPCPSGYYCKCDRCKGVKAAAMREFRKSKMENKHGS